MKYLIGSSSKDVIYKPDKEKGIEYFVDADFTGAWDSSDQSNPENIVLHGLHYYICRMFYTLVKPPSD